MDTKLIREMQELLKRIEKFELNSKDHPASSELAEIFKDMEKRTREHSLIKAQNESKLDELTKKITELKVKTNSEPDIIKRRTLFNEVKELENEKEFLNLNNDFRITPILAKESSELYKSEKWRIAHQKEFGRFADNATKLADQLKEMTKKIEAQITLIQNSHPFNYINERQHYYRRF